MFFLDCLKVNGSLWTALFLLSLHSVSSQSLDLHVQPGTVLFGSSLTTPGTKLFFDQSRAAFRVGEVRGDQWNAANLGRGSFAFGRNSVASGIWSTGLGSSVVASGDHSFAVGSNSHATGQYSTAIGLSNLAGGQEAISMGRSSNATGQGSIALGNSCLSNNLYSVAIGHGASAEAYEAISLGSDTEATGSSSIAMGKSTVASGSYATAAGFQTKGIGPISTALGYLTTARGQGSVAAGFATNANGQNSIALGQRTITGGIAAIALGNGSIATGDYSTAMGTSTSASGRYSTAIGKEIGTGGEGSFVVGDSEPANNGTFVTTVSDQFVARFNNGYYFLTSGTSSRTGIRAPHGANAWSSICDVNQKENFSPVNCGEILNKLGSISFYTWNYKGQNPQNYRHYGIMAQDFFASFGKDEYGVIGCDTLVNAIDMMGVAMSAIKGLKELADDQHELIMNLRAEVLELKKWRIRQEN